MRHDLEFRCFVYNNRLCAISQYNHYCVFESVQELSSGDGKRELIGEIVAYWQTVHPSLPSYDAYVLDVARLGPGWLHITHHTIHHHHHHTTPASHHTTPHHTTPHTTPHLIQQCLSRLSLEAVPRNLWDHKKIVRSPSIVSYGCGQNKPGQGPLRRISNTKTTKD